MHRTMHKYIDTFTDTLRLLFFGFLLLFCRPVLADEPHIALSEYFIETWSTKDGLPHNSINDIAQTREGYLWFGTWEGFARYNGKTFQIFERGGESGMPDSGTLAFVAGPDGSLLVAGARGGLSSWKEGVWTPYAPAPTMIGSAMRDSKGNLWVTMPGKGLLMRPANETRATRDVHIIDNVTANKSVEDANGIIWAATDNGLYQVIDNKATLVSPGSGLPQVRAFSLLVTNDNTLLVGTEGGVWKRVGEDFQPLHPALTNEVVSTMMQDKRGDIWFGTINHGIFRLSPEGLEHLNIDNGIVHNRVQSILEDREQSIWIGTNSGLIRLRRAPFITISTRQGLNGDYVRTVMTHSDGSILVGTSTGLNRIRDGHVEQINWDQHTQPSVLSLGEATDGSVWVGTYTDGLLHWKNGQLTPVLQQSNGLPGNEVRAILTDHQQNLWIGTASGLSVLRPNRALHTYSADDGLPASFIMALQEDEQHRIWVGTGVGVSVFHNGKFEHIDISAMENAEYAFGFYSEPGYMWMTTDRGLLRYRSSDGAIGMVGRKNGLPIDKLFQVIPDNMGYLWLSSNRGMIRISKAEAVEVIEGRKQQIAVTTFGESDGMISAQANGGSMPAATRAGDGGIWVATARGAVMVHPERLGEFSKTRLAAVVESVESNTTPLNKDYTFPAGTTRIRINYSGLGYVLPERIRYRTRLEGFDPQWIDRENNTSAEYTNLPPGNYRFNVSASYPNGEWNGANTVINLRINPFFWQRPLFQALLVLLILLALFAIFRWRLRQARRNEERLRTLVAAKTLALQEQAEEFERQAKEDQLTRLANRRVFDKQLMLGFDDARAHDYPLTLAIFDIDHFKQINDRWSHVVGDKVLQSIGDLLRNTQQDARLSARWGGEEFTLLFPHMPIAQAAAICESLRVTLSQTDYRHIADGLQVTASFGLAESSSANDSNALIKQADHALYIAKQTGRNKVVCWSGEEDIAPGHFQI
ncbi:MAG: two-component regulator propeller domain-containing protein [Enterobacteriaceae bacterium]|nr:two-component regulator propeller domain-containing protein [Enterobacteriaceae bacterium]